MLLVVLLAAISGSVIWLTLSSPPDKKAATPTAKIDFAAPKEDKADIPMPEPAKPATQATAMAAKKAGEDREKSDPAKTDQIVPSKPGTATPAMPPAKDAQPDEPKLPDTAQATAPPVDTTPPTKEPRTKAPLPARPPETEKPMAEKAPPAVSAQNGPTTAPPLVSIIPKLPRPPPSTPLPLAPDPALIEETQTGSLPIVGRDGREAWRVYGRPFDREDRRPKIAIVLYGLGSSAAATRTAIQGLPGAISLAFSPYADGLRGWIADARAAGHEALLMVPMEPVNFPNDDPGPQALLTSLTTKQNTSRLEWILGRAVGYVGVTDFMGSRFTSSTPHMRSFFRNLKLRGLMYLESQSASRVLAAEIAAANRVPYVPNALYIDSQASRTAIDAQLAEAERLAKKLGEVTVMGFLYPVTLERVANWAKTIGKRGMVLAPVSALAKRR